MLVLTRKLCEEIVIPQCQLSLTVFEIRGNMVRLGISAPPEVAVHRGEVWREILAEGSDAAEAEPRQDSMDALAARLTDAAYQIALRHRSVDSWVDLELGLGRALATTLKRFSPSSSRPVQNSELETTEDQAVRLPR